MIWQAWIQDYGYSDEQNVARPPLEEAEKGSAPTTETTTPLLTIEQNTTAEEERYKEGGQGEKISVTTDVLDIVINTIGGTVEYVALKKYPISKKSYIQTNKSINSSISVNIRRLGTKNR